MYELLKEKFKNVVDIEEKTNKVREYLQILSLKILFDHNFFDNSAFVCGTALRIIYDLRRFSEDLDFCLINKKNYSFGNIIDVLGKELNRYGLKVESTKKENNTVNVCMLKFTDLLNELKISSIKGQKLSIKIEIDTNTPHGWETMLTPINKSFMFAIRHFDLSSLYATKLHACFYRKYTKGRDFYDLVWYLGKKTVPNFKLLNNAIKQTEDKSLNINKNNFKEFLSKNIEKVDFKVIKKDVEHFLEDKNELKLLEKNIILQLVDSVI
ncbi:MAG: nucleotidyl transferase AbiEii/AbiGii toxin family protein [Elusimicrobiota bacterium]